jgi:transcription termination factor Rho
MVRCVDGRPEQITDVLRRVARAVLQQMD